MAQLLGTPKLYSCVAIGHFCTVHVCIPLIPVIKVGKYYNLHKERSCSFKALCGIFDQL